MFLVVKISATIGKNVTPNQPQKLRNPKAVARTYVGKTSTELVFLDRHGKNCLEKSGISYSMHTVGFAHVIFAITNDFNFFSLFQGASSNSACHNCASENRNKKNYNVIWTEVRLYHINW